MTDPNSVPTSDQVSPLSPDNYDPISSELRDLHRYLRWIDEHHQSFLRLRYTEPELAEQELHHLTTAIAQFKSHLGGLTWMILTGNTLDPAASLRPGIKQIARELGRRELDPPFKPAGPSEGPPVPKGTPQPLIDPATIPRPGEGPQDSIKKEIDAVEFSLGHLHGSALWFSEHHQSFISHRDTDTKYAEQELGYLPWKIAHARKELNRLTELLLAGYTIDPAKRRLGRLEHWL